MQASNDNNQIPPWELTAQLHFMAQNYADLVKIISALPMEQKKRFEEPLMAINDFLIVLHDIAEKL